MNRDDTFPLPEERMRSCFQRLTTAEAVKHADTIWPYLDTKIDAMLDDKIKDAGVEAARDALYHVISDMMELDPSSSEDRNKVKRLFRFLFYVIAAQSALTRMCIRCILPWILTALVGILGLALKDDFPAIADSVRKLSLPGGP